MSDTKRRKKEPKESKDKDKKKKDSSKKTRKPKEEPKVAEEAPMDEDEVFLVDDDDAPLLADDDDDGFIADDPTEIELKPGTKQKDYECLHPEDLIKAQQTLIETTADLLTLPPPTARLLLVHYKWDADALQAGYWEDPEGLYKKLGIISPEKASQLKSLKKGSKYECSICLDDVKSERMNQLPCGHLFCKDCLGDYCADAVDSNANVSSVRCPDRKCPIQLDDTVVSNLLTASKSAKTLIPKYHKILANSYVNSNDHMKWCPGTDCQNAVKADLLSEPLVVCDCKTKFCFSCGNLPHAPATCKMMIEWEGKRSKDEANTKFLAAYTKNCPKCNHSIFKEGGCQYIRCQCGHAFCWICMGNFDHVNHGCNAFNPVGDPTSARAQLAKYAHYLGRYEAHAQSVDLEQKLQGMAEKTRDELQNQGFSFVEANFVFESLESLKAARNLLKLTYVYGFYMPEKVPRQIFEHLQGKLEESVEKLSGLLESKNEKPDRKKILNLAANVSSQEANLMKTLNDPTWTSAVKAEEDYGKYGSTDTSKYDGWIYTTGS